ncbi:chitin synthase-domain-containing protein [Pisolithus orientalis]|uniref:chitin synthase-domain-containing protein n=1 Tax=Pisolithus orientalis TaxID=936130 RepID=UPI0022245419|nr:chitin synthase-domain-containing protein [Pisolithus orientalis]KAI6006351.1 chitin synthase-domain-containing protein [Pisolithus orientalis]
MVSTKSVLQYGGMASDVIFPVQGSVSPWVMLDSANNTDPNAQYHDFCAFTNDSRPELGTCLSEIKDMANTICLLSLRLPVCKQAGGINTQFMSSTIVDLFKINSGQDFMKKFKDGLGLDSATLESQRTCLRNLFLISAVDNRNSPQFLLVLMVSIIGFKFIASINFGAVHAPKDHDKFRTLLDLAMIARHHVSCLIFWVLTRTWTLNLLSFVLIGEGARQHNMAKVYSGLYECAGHVVPYLVVIKVGKPDREVMSRNHVMHFLNKVHYNMPMNPLELEMYHQIKNVIMHQADIL